MNTGNEAQVNSYLPPSSMQLQQLLHFNSAHFSGNLHKTEKIYKYHMQVQDEDDEEAVPVTPTKSSPEATPVKESPAASD